MLPIFFSEVLGGVLCSNCYMQIRGWFGNAGAVALQCGTPVPRCWSLHFAHAGRCGAGGSRRLRKDQRRLGAGGGPGTTAGTGALVSSTPPSVCLQREPHQPENGCKSFPSFYAYEKLLFQSLPPVKMLSLCLSMAVKCLLRDRAGSRAGAARRRLDHGSACPVSGVVIAARVVKSPQACSGVRLAELNQTKRFA